MSKLKTLHAFLASIALLGVSLSASPSLATPFTIAPVATTGQAVGPDGQTIIYFGDDASGSKIDVNDLGQVAYTASTTPVGEVPPTGVFRGMAGQAPDIIAYQGDNLGPADGVLFVVGSQVSINNAGETAFTASISTGGTFKDGLFLGDGNAAPAVTAFDGQPAGPVGDSFNSFCRQVSLIMERQLLLDFLKAMLREFSLTAVLGRRLMLLCRAIRLGFLANSSSYPFGWI